MSDPFCDLHVKIRPDQDRLIRFIAGHMNTRRSVIARWLMDAGYHGLLIRAGLHDADIPVDARPPRLAAP